VFLETNRVELVGPWDYHSLPKDKPGTEFEGLLREVVDLGLATFDNVLKVKFTVQKVRGKVKRVRVRFALFHSLHCEVGIISAAGGLREDIGTITAVPCKASDQRTELTVDKTVNFCDLTPNDPGVVIDYGKIMSYLGPAALCMWVDELCLLVPCCDAKQVRQSTPRSPGR
jgi:hypothetical protein